MRFLECTPVKGTFLLKNRYFTVVEPPLSLCMRNAFQTTNKVSVYFLRVENAVVFTQEMIYSIASSLLF